MQISQVMTSYTQPNFDQIAQFSHPLHPWGIFLHKLENFRIMFSFFFLHPIRCPEFLSEMFDFIPLKVFHNMSLTVLSLWQHTGFQTPNIEGISGHLQCSIFISGNGALYARSSSRITMLAHVCDLVWGFSS